MEISDRNLKALLWVRRISIVLIVISLIYVARTLPVGRGIQHLTGVIEDLGMIGPLVYALIYALVTISMIPASPLSIGAGALFGLGVGTITVVLGATLGMAGAFLIARYVARGSVERTLSKYPRFAAIDRAVGEGGWKIVGLLRLSPAVPFNLQNYFYGLTAIRFLPCVATSAVAIIPGAFMYVYLGYAGRAGLTAASAGGTERGLGQWIMLTVGLVATVVVTVYITRIARRAIKNASENEEVAAVASQEQPAGAPKSGWPRTLVAATAAIVAVALATLAHFNAGMLKNIFGPPSVALAEAYEEDAGSATFDHAVFDGLLKRHVNENGGVDYGGIAKEQPVLTQYIESIAEAPFKALGRDGKLALLINAYNAFTLQLILEHLDSGITSIRDIPASQRWDARRWNIAGKEYSLNEIEHQEIRPKFKEPNIHWVLVCAAVGCPPLRNEAYTEKNLPDQLEAQAKIVHTDGSRWLRFEEQAEKIHLTKLYDWYGEDFEQVAGSILAYVARYFAPLETHMEGSGQVTVEWLPYDWALNNQENLP